MPLSILFIQPTSGRWLFNAKAITGLMLPYLKRIQMIFLRWENPELRYQNHNQERKMSHQLIRNSGHTCGSLQPWSYSMFTGLHQLCMSGSCSSFLNVLELSQIKWWMKTNFQSPPINSTLYTHKVRSRKLSPLCAAATRIHGKDYVVQLRCNV